MGEDLCCSTNPAELRRLAEEQLRVSDIATERDAGEQRRLLHELEVHRIELEMQNAELRKARTNAETALDKYTDLYDFAPVGYFSIDRTTTIHSVNLTGSTLLGLERSHLNGRRFEYFVAVSDRPAFASFLTTVFSSGVKETCEVTLLREGQTLVFVQLEAMVAASGLECRVALIDVTKRKLAEQALQNAEIQAGDALQAVEEEAEHALLKMQSDMEEVLRLQRFAPLSAEPGVETTDASRLREEAADAARRKMQLAADFARQKVERAAETALKKVAKSTLLFRLEREAAEATARVKSQFLANMSHELRTPMNGILGMLQLALRDDVDPNTRECLEATLVSAKSLLRILNDILDLSRMEARMFTLEDKPFSLNDCVAGATNFITPEAHRKQLSFVVSLSEGIPEIICGDQFRLRQVLVNLLGNAVKFTDKGKVELRVKVGPTAVGGKLRLIFSVRDTGIGIHGEQIGRLFQPFSQADESHNRCFGGAGLGLAISKEIVEMMGGTISLTSEEGKWSDFTFTVPFAEARLEDETPGGAAPPENATRLAHAEANKRRILIAEDNEISRDVLLKLLTRHDYQVDFAENGREAVELWQECAYDLILMDIQMPRMNGFQATKAIRESERARGSAARTPIVAMTAHAAKEDEHRCLVAGMDGHISKPIDLKETLDTIAKIFAEQALT